MNKIIVVLLVLEICIISFLFHNLQQDYDKSLDMLEQLIEQYQKLAQINRELKNQINDLNQLLNNKQIEINDLNEQIRELKQEQINKPVVKKKSPTVSRSKDRSLPFKATAYDLSVNSCGKPVGSEGYGITANGTCLKGKSREQAMTVAVDPKVIKLGTKLKITFPKPYEHFNGVYTANDTGGAIKGNKIDIFMGDFQNNETHQSVWDFGVRDVKVEIVK